MNMSITKVGNVARKSLLPLAAAGALIAGVASCKSNQNAEAPKSEIELCREAVAKAQEKCRQDSIAFSQADSIIAKQRFAEIQALTKDLPMDSKSKWLAEYNAAMGDKIASKSIEVADKYQPLYTAAQRNCDIATGDALKKSKEELETAKANLEKAERDSVKLAELDNLDKKADSLVKEMILSALSHLGEDSAEPTVWLEKIYNRN